MPFKTIYTESWRGHEEYVQKRGEAGYKADMDFVRAIKPELDAKIEKGLKERGWDTRRGRMGFCHLLWRVKNEILKEEYGICIRPLPLWCD